MEFLTAAQVPLETHVSVFNDAFTGYIGGEVNMTLPGYYGFLHGGNIDVNLSGFAMDNNLPVAFGMVARQGSTSRLAVMGVVQSHQGQRVGAWLLERLIEQARERGDKAYILECFEQNTRGIKLYQRLGFEITERLMGYTLQVDNAYDTPVPELEPIDVYEVARQLMWYGDSSLPWQASGTQIARIGAPHVGYKLGEAYGVFTDPSADVVSVRALVVPPEHQSQGQARALVRAVMGLRAGARQWRIGQICPAWVGQRVFEKLGFERMELNQVHMRLKL